MEEKYRFTDKAKKQLKENFKYYDNVNSKLGNDFIQEVNDKVEQIANRPESHSVVYKDVRKASLKRFPFFIYYSLRDAVVYILSIWHKKREQKEE